MGRYLVKRILVIIPVFLCITIFVFVLSNMAPGSPLDLLRANGGLSEERYEQLEKQLGLDKPVIVRYAVWLGDLVTGDLGTSTRTQSDVSALIADRIGPTLILSGTSVLIAVIVAIPLGTMAAKKPYSLWDNASSVLCFLGSSIPNFFIALVLVYFISVKLGWLPATGMWYKNDPHTLGNLAVHLVMPVIVLVIQTLANLLKQTRSAMLEVFNEEYIKTARSKGLPEGVVTIKHVLRNALIPIVTTLSLEIPFLVGGAAVTEQIFAWPGMGTLMVTSINQRDYNTIMGCTVVIAVCVLVVNLLLDVVYAFLDPRIRLD